MDTKVKNMAYWKAKNGIVTDTPIPGISHTSDGNEKDGRSPSSAFQQKTIHGKLTKKIEHERPQAHGELRKFIEGEESEEPKKPTKPIAGTGGAGKTAKAVRTKIIKGVKHIWDTVKNMWVKG